MSDKEDNIEKSYHELTDGSIFAIGGKASSFNIVNRNTDSNIDDLQERLDSTEDKLERDKYYIKKEVARGGMGAILEVEDRELKRIIAMKVLKNSPLSESREIIHISDIKSFNNSIEVERFIREARITGKLEHPNIIPIHDLGIDENNRPFFTMKMIKGKTLSEVIKLKEEEYSLRKLLKIFIQSCNAVAFAHSQNVVHRDIKSSNIMIGEYGEVLVMDWGLAKIEGESEPLCFNDNTETDDINQTQVGTIIGTPAYMSPEQAKGDTTKIDTRSDIFSLGAVLYEILNKNPPYHGKNTQSILSNAINANPDFKNIRNKIPKEILRICQKAMSKKREDRYQRVDEFSSDIQAFLDNRVIPKYNISIWKNLWQNFTVIFGFALFIMILNGSGVGELYLFYDEPSIIVILGYALIYQFLCHGISILFVKRKNIDTAVSTLMSVQFQNGAIIGGLYGSMHGVFSMLHYLHDSSIQYFDNLYNIGRNFGVVVLTLLYIFPFFLILRVNYIKKARKLSLFSIISPFSKIEVIKILSLFVVSFMVIGLFLNFIQQVGVNFQNISLDISGMIVHGISIILISLVFTLLFFRMVFTYKELFVAISHIFLVFSGGDVEKVNKIHAAAVLRFYTEILLLVLYTSCIIRFVNLCVNIGNPNRVLYYLIPIVLIYFTSFFSYIIVNLIINKYLIRSNKSIESNELLNKKIVQLYKKENKLFWFDTIKGKIKYFFVILVNIGFNIWVLFISGTPVFSVAGVFGIVIILILVTISRVNLVNLRNSFYKEEIKRI